MSRDRLLTDVEVAITRRRLQVCLADCDALLASLAARFHVRASTVRRAALGFEPYNRDVTVPYAPSDLDLL